MEGDTSREPFGFAMAVLGSTIMPTTVNSWLVTAVKLVLTPLFITVDIFALVVPLTFSRV